MDSDLSVCGMVRVIGYGSRIWSVCCGGHGYHDGVCQHEEIGIYVEIGYENVSVICGVYWIDICRDDLLGCDGVHEIWSEIWILIDRLFLSDFDCGKGSAA